MRSAKISRPEAGSQAVRGIPCDSYRLRLIAYHLHGKYRPEDLLTDDRVVWSGTGHHSRLEIGAARLSEHPLPPDPERGPLGKTSLEMSEHALQTPPVDKGPHLGIGKQRIGREPLARGLHDPLHHSVGHIGMNHQ